MALIDAGAKCAICDKPLDRPFLCSSGCAFPREHRLWRYCDAPIHIECLQDWPDREEFCSAYFRQRLQQYQRERWYVLARGLGWFCGRVLPYPGTIYATADFDFVEIMIEDWPIRFLAHVSDWAHFIGGGWQADAQDLHSYALARAQVVVAEVRAAIPDAHTLYRLIKSHEDG